MTLRSLASYLLLALLGGACLLVSACLQPQQRTPLPLRQDPDDHARRLGPAYRAMCIGDHVRPDYRARIEAAKGPSAAPDDNVCRMMRAMVEEDWLTGLQAYTHDLNVRMSLQPADLPVEYAMINFLKGDMRTARQYILILEHEDQTHVPGMWRSALPGASDYFGGLNDGRGLMSLGPSLAVFYNLEIEPYSAEIRRNALQLIISSKLKALSRTFEQMNRLEAASDAQHVKLLQELRVGYSEASDVWARAALRQTVPTPKESEAVLHRLSELESEFNGYTREALQSSPGPRVTRVQAALGPNDALVEFVMAWLPPYSRGVPVRFDPKSEASEIHYAAYVLSHGGQEVAVDLGKASAIDTLIGDYRCAIEHPSDDGPQRWKRLRTASLPLYSLIWKPLLAGLPRAGTGGHVYVSADGDLARLPFDALIDDSATGHYMLLNWNISYVTSGRDLPRLKTVDRDWTNDVGDGADIAVFIRPKTGGVSNAVSNVGHGCRETALGLDRQYSALEGSEREADDIRREFGKARIFGSKLRSAGEPTEAILKSIHSPRVLHLATHGYYVAPPPVTIPMAPGEALTDRPPFRWSRSGFILGEFGSARTHEDGVVTSLEAALLDLRKTDLVVLSACDSGVGDAAPGEGAGGLRNALQIAGAKSVVSALWTVSDTAGQQLMNQFYRDLGSGETVDLALRHAKVCTLKAHPDPYYWAAFVLDGKDDVCLRNACASTMKMSEELHCDEDYRAAQTPVSR